MGRFPRNTGVITRAAYVCTVVAMLIAAGIVASKRSALAASPQDEVLATTQAIEGDVSVQRAGEASFTNIRVRDPLHLNDFLKTEKRSKVWWEGEVNAFSRSATWQPIPEVAHGSLGADSVFGFVDFRRTGPSYRWVGHVPKGSVRFIKSLPRTNPSSQFIIATPTAWIEVLYSDRAADFIVQSSDRSLTTVTVLWGKVRVRNVSDDFAETRILSSCQEVDVQRDEEPGEVRWVSADSLDKLVTRTTIPDTLPTDLPACERVKTEVILDPGDVFIPPPGVILFPVPFPIPGDGDDGDQCPCPSGYAEDPHTGECECCPPGTVFNERTCDCSCPCPEGYSLHAETGDCIPCRRGASYNSQTCACECPCPPGEALLPGQGCVRECPSNYVLDYDLSQQAPYRCPICRRGEPDQPQVPRCQSSEDCPGCRECRRGRCVAKRCGLGEILDTRTCDCVPVEQPREPECTANRECPPCQECVEGRCRPMVQCGPSERLNPETCRCDPIPQRRDEPREPQDECTSNRDCPEGQWCRNGQCVDRPERRRRRRPVEDPGVDFDDSFFEEPQRPRRPRRPPIQIDIGVGLEKKPPPRRQRERPSQRFTPGGEPVPQSGNIGPSRTRPQ